MVKMLKKIVYTLSIICLIILTIITKNMIPLIFKSKIYGIIYLLFIITLLICELFALIKFKNVLKKNFSYNLFLILITTYISIIYYKIYSINSSVIYNLDIKYLGYNYLFLSLIVLIVLIDLYLGINDYKKKVIK